MLFHQVYTNLRFSLILSGCSSVSSQFTTEIVSPLSVTTSPHLECADDATLHSSCAELNALYPVSKPPQKMTNTKKTIKMRANVNSKITDEVFLLEFVAVLRLSHGLVQ